jgi:hypothetical protein
MLLPVFAIYLLSHAPVRRMDDKWWAKSNSYRNSPTREFAFTRIIPKVYRPADWVYDHTPLQRPLLMWARLWSVDRHFENAYRVREFHRQTGHAFDPNRPRR